jgi:hypothetical protein
VIVSEPELVMRIADWAIDGGSASDHIRDSSQKPSVELMQLLVFARETAVRIEFIATANVNQTARFIPGLIRRGLTDFPRDIRTSRCVNIQ